MKKSLVLAMAMALGVTASAYAANPFSDVPAGHWAYDSISKLAAAGVIEGYGDDTFRGDRLMTRYEMAQIVAKAMAKGANVDKLAAEFADELDALGVRVAALEKKSDNVKITGQIRYHWAQGKVGDAHKNDSVLRSRLHFTGKINDNWSYKSRMENRQVFQDGYGIGENNNYIGEDAKLQWKWANLQGRLGGLNVVAGRFALALGHSEDDIFSDSFDGIQIGYGSKVRFGAYYGKPAHFDWRERDAKHDIGYKKGYGVNLEADLGKNVTMWVGWDKFDKNDESAKALKDDNSIWNVGAQYHAKDWSLAAAYAKSNNSGDYYKDNGFYVDLKYKGAKASTPGSWGAMVKYYHWGDGVTLGGQHGWDNAFTPDANGFKGFKVGVNYAVAKNMVGEIIYWDGKDHKDGQKAKTLWTALNVSF